MSDDHKVISRRRHLAKTATYRLSSMTIMFGLTWIVTGSPGTGATVGVLDFVVMSAVYYLHERAWYRFGWGVMEHQPEKRPKPVKSLEV